MPSQRRISLDIMVKQSKGVFAFYVTQKPLKNHFKSTESLVFPYFMKFNGRTQMTMI